MEFESGLLVCVGDSALPFIILGAVVIALVALIVAYVFMRRKK
ncbi:MAG: LPXTG cell wall anchor domain-containing protein [Raoultibacter sp.]